MSEENKALVRRFVEEVQSKHNLDLVEDIFDPGFVNHAVVTGLPEGMSDVEAFKVFYRMILQAFPDINAEIHVQVAEADKVVTHKTFHGTHQGEFLGITPTGVRVHFDVTDIFRVADNKLVEHWAVRDMMGLMQQIGAVPPPGKGGA